MNIKKAMALSLATCITFSPVALKAESEDKDIVPINSPIVMPAEDEAKEAEYIEFKGKIEKVENENDMLYILVRNNQTEGLDLIKAYINDDVILLSDKTLGFSKTKDLAEGLEVTIFYHKDTIMTMSYPPMLGPDVVVINDNEDYQGTMVSKFNKDLLNAEGSMIIRPSDDTVIVDKDGKALETGDLANRDLIVFYDIVLESYPGQTSPKKIVVMPVREETSLETPVEQPEESQPKEFKEFILRKEFIKELNGVQMIPLRLVGESLGYEVTWNQETKTAELVRGAQWTSVTIGKDNYNFAKMLVKLGVAPELIDSKTYVPSSFIEEVLKAKVEVITEGLKILY